jgi:hypothetical protein
VTEQENQHRDLPQWISWLVYGLLAVLMTWPLAQQLNTHFGGTDTDIFNVFWGNWWVRTALASGHNPYVTEYLIYPKGFDLVTFAFSPFLALLWIPFSWFMSPIAAYNVVVWVTIVLCCVAMDQLVRYLTGNPWAALVAGITFAFAPRVVAERASHLNMALVAWLPWVALLLTRLMREARIRDAILLAVTIGLSFLTRPQVGVLVLLFGGIYFLGLAASERGRWHRLAVGRLVVAGLLSILLLSPLLVQAWDVFRQPGAESLLREGAEERQTDLLAYVLPTPKHPLFGHWTEAIYDQQLLENKRYWAFVGFVPLVLGLYAVISQPRKALPWLLTGAVFFVLALGPYLQLNGENYEQLKLPYALAPDFFSAIGFDSPNRFDLALAAAFSVLVGLACAQISVRLGKRWLLAIPAVLILGEYVVDLTPLKPVPMGSPFYAQMAADTESYAIVDLPLTREAGEIHRYFQTIHHKPIVGGWDFRVPSGAFDFIDGNPLLGTWRGNDQPDVTFDNALAELSEANVRYIVVHRRQPDYRKGEITSVPERTRSLLFALNPVYEDGNIYVLPVEAMSGQGYNLAHRFDENVALLPLTFYTSVLANQDGTQLSLETCWLFGDEGPVVDQSRVQVKDPRDSLVYDETALLSHPSQGLVCQHWPMEEQLGTYTANVPIYVLQNETGALVPVVGYALHTIFDAPIEMLGYNLTEGDGFVWTDLYWRGLEEHIQNYLLSIELIDPKTGQRFLSDHALMPKSEWGSGDLFHERRISWLDNVPQGQYSMGVSLHLDEKPQELIPALNASTNEQWPGNVVMLDIPLLVLPASLKGSSPPGEGRLVVYTSAQNLPAEPRYPITASFGDVGQLNGYSLEPNEVRAGEKLELTLYWTAMNTRPVTTDYRVFVHLLDESGQIIAQHDGQPVEGRRSTSTWQQGDKIIDTHRLEWLTDESVGTAVLQVGLYELQTLGRLPAYGATGERLPEDRVILSEIELR